MTPLETHLASIDAQLALIERNLAAPKAENSSEFVKWLGTVVVTALSIGLTSYFTLATVLEAKVKEKAAEKAVTEAGEIKLQQYRLNELAHNYFASVTVAAASAAPKDFDKESLHLHDLVEGSLLPRPLKEPLRTYHDSAVRAFNELKEFKGSPDEKQKRAGELLSQLQRADEKTQNDIDAFLGFTERK